MSAHSTAIPTPAVKVPILMVGLPPDHPSLIGKKPAHEVAAGLAMVQKKFDASPYAMTQHLLSPEDPLEPYIASLKSQPWRGLVIGFGVRSSMELTSFFEQLVGLAQEHAPQARFCFNAGLPDTMASVQRNVPIVPAAEEGKTNGTVTEKATGEKTDGVVAEKAVEGKKEGLGRSESRRDKRKSWDWRRVLRQGTA